MTKEMLFLCDVYTNWCDSQNLPNFYSADDLCYGRDTKDKLTPVSYTHLTLPTKA